MTIGQLANAAGVPTTTVRFYERAKLLRPDRRTVANYRDYSPAALERLRFIRSAQAVGLSMKDIAELLDLTRTDKSPCADIAQLLQNRLAEIRRKMRDLRQVERKLKKSLATCCSPGEVGLCVAVHKLRGKKSCACP